MTFENFDSVFLTAIFILPGFLINGVINAINPPKKDSDGIYFLKCLTFSIVNCACWSWLYSIIIRGDYSKPFLPWLLLVTVTIVGASLLAIGIAIFKQSSVAGKLLQKMHIKTIHSTPTAWDYFFSQQRPVFVIITLLDGTILRGWYSSRSFSSSDPDSRDLFVEVGYKIKEDGKWELDEDSEGFYVTKDQIKYIEFKKGA